MDERVRFIEHRGQQVLLIDFSGLAGKQLLQIVNHVRETIAHRAPNSMLTLADFSGANVNKAAAARIKEVLVLDRPFVKRSAWVGVESLPKVFYDNFKSFSQRTFPTFATREEALEWLVSAELGSKKRRLSRRPKEKKITRSYLLSKVPVAPNSRRFATARAVRAATGAAAAAP